MDENELIKALLAGDENAFRQLVQSYHNLMKQVARSIVGDAIAEEVVQDAWIAVIKGLDKFEGRSQLKTWILRIVSNSAKTRLRKEARSIAVGDAEDVQKSTLPAERFKQDGHWAIPPSPWHSDQPDQLLASEQLQQQLSQAIDQLPANQQAVLILREMEGLTMEEVCKILDISESNARVLLHRARTKLWQVVESSEV